MSHYKEITRQKSYSKVEIPYYEVKNAIVFLEKLISSVKNGKSLARINQFLPIVFSLPIAE